MNFTGKYHLHCTLTYGDIYGQVIVWLLVIFASLAAALSLMSSPLYASLTVGLILVVSLPFLLFAFVTTLLNHIEFEPMEASQMAAGGAQPARAQTAG
ncbi:MAG: hypothetical protein HC921_04390 [Synechococcaceae cyanobacterium SM2_3_1]|nr:hypothetical protein [Synechococcaceae cyanobacterium SM2_3_1]